MSGITTHQLGELKDLLEEEIEDIENPSYRIRAILDEDAIEEGKIEEYLLQAGGDFNVYLNKAKTNPHIMVKREEWNEESEALYETIREVYGELDWP